MKTKGIIAVVLGTALILSGCGGGGGNEVCEHVWGTWTEETAATCTQEGMEKRICSKCGKEEKQKTPAAGHKWGTWQETKAPTCTVKGTQERECNACHEKETKEVEAIGHAEGIWDSDGEGHWKKCPVCGEALTEKEPHTAENGECSVCGGEVIGLEYAVYENECHVIGSGTEQGDIVIPATFCGKPVTEIGEKAFYWDEITSVVIPDSVKIIHKVAFSECSKLRRVQLGDSVMEIGQQAFSGDNSLSEIVFPASLEKIEEQAFYGCGILSIEFPSDLRMIGDQAFGESALQSVTIPGRITEIGARTFYLCKDLRSIQFEVGIKEIPADVCYGCTSLVSVSLPEGVESIGGTAFGKCEALAQITIPSSVRTIHEGAFEYSGLQEITIPDSVETLENAVFYSCKSLRRAVIGNGVISIGEMNQFSDVGTFENCVVLESVTIGRGVTSIASRAFQDCALLTSIDFLGTTDEWKAVEKEKNWKPSMKEYGFLVVTVLEKVVCNNGTLTGKDMG